MRKLISVCILLIALTLNFDKSWGFKKGYKNIKKLPKSEVDVKAFIFPCSIYDEEFLNSSLATNRKHLKNCNRKIVIRMKINSGGEYRSKSDGFIPVYHVVDGITGRKKRLLHPIMLRIKRGIMHQLYDLHLVKSVNAEAREDVLQYENTAKFSGCDTSSSHPTCGYSFFKNKIIQFSEGFCCSCDQSVNDQRQPCDGRPGERNRPPDMKLAVRPQRSNRTSRGLDAVKKKNKQSYTITDNNEHPMPVVDIKPVELKTEKKLLENTEDSIEKNSLGEKVEFSEDASQEGTRLDDSNDHRQGITIRSFQFEHSVAQIKGNCSAPEKISSVNILINNDKNTYENSSDSKCETSGMSSAKFISPEILKSLIKNRIKVNENYEKVSPTVPTVDESASENVKKSPCHARSLFGNRENINSSGEKPCKSDKQDNKTFALKLLSGNSELEINIATRTPATTLKKKLSSPHLKTSTKACESSTRKSLKSVINNWFAHTSNESSTHIHEQKGTTKQVRCSVGKKNNSLDSLEKIAYEFIPIMNNAGYGSDPGGKKVEVIFNGIENTTQHVYIQVSNHTISKVTKPLSLGENMMPLEGKWHENNLKTDSNSGNSYFKSISSMISNNLKTEEDVERLEHEIETPIVSSEFKRVRKNHIEKREACGKQIRGGQTCSGNESSVPCYADSESYFESAHCLRFSDLWYNVHRLANPKIENEITVKVYAKHQTSAKKACWEHLTKHVPGRVGAAEEVLTDGRGSVAIAYSSDDSVAYSLDCSSDFLLVPQPLPKRCKSAELRSLGRGGPGEYLVLREGEISFDGDECDRAGVTFAAFARQPRRCRREAGACLGNQPLRLWRQAREAEAAGRRGRRFLRDHVTVGDQAVLLNATSNQVVLRAPYRARHASQVVAELNADRVDVIADRSEGQATEVYVDATAEKTSVTAVVTNMGMAVELFSVDLVNCSRPLGPYDFDRPGKKEIPPQHRRAFTATLSAPLALKRTECRLAVYGVDRQVVASRRALFVRGERCVCVWHCRCVCHDFPERGLPCSPLSLTDFQRAGFPGHLPGRASGTRCATLFVVAQALLFFFLSLLLFGLVKAALGLCLPAAAVWGLWRVVPDDVRRLPLYLECGLASRRVVFDCDGHPVDPYSFRRTVRFLPRCTEFVINVLFFVLFARRAVCNCLTCMNSNSRYEDLRCQKRGCSPYSPCARSPCSSVCSGARRGRLFAGGEEKEPQALADEVRARRFVEKLSGAYVVYRNMKRPVGGVQAVPGTPYSVRGYFVEAENGVYEFHPPSPLVQVRGMDAVRLSPPVVLDAAPFRALYRSASEVLASSLTRAPEGVVINES